MVASCTQHSLRACSNDTCRAPLDSSTGCTPKLSESLLHDLGRCLSHVACQDLRWGFCTNFWSGTSYARYIKVPFLNLLGCRSSCEGRRLACRVGANMLALTTVFTAKICKHTFICFKFEAGAKTRLLLRAGQKLNAV